MRIGIIGAGMSGLACADVLVAGGHEVALFDKGRGAGGRMATRRLDTPLGLARFDHGAQYFTVRHPDFARAVADWQKAGVAVPWPCTGDDAWVGTPGMSAVVREVASRHDVRFGARVTGMKRDQKGWTLLVDHEETGVFDAVVVALPAEQAATLLSLHDFALATIALRARSQPCWAGMFAFADRLPAPDEPIRDRRDVSWAVRNSAKPGRSGPESWVIHAQPAWSADHLELAADEVQPMLLDLLGASLGTALPDPIAASAHRWRFAMASATGDTALWNPATRLGACGDWLLGPRVECAFLSGQALARRISGEV